MRTTKAVNQTRREVILKPTAEVPNRWVAKRSLGTTVSRNNWVAKTLGQNGGELHELTCNLIATKHILIAK